MECRPDLLFTAARAEARRMKDTAAEAKAGQQIAIAPAQFWRLAQLLETLVESKQPAVDPDGFDATVDGIRFWIPLPQVEIALKELRELRAAAEAEAPPSKPASPLWPFDAEH